MLLVCLYRKPPYSVLDSSHSSGDSRLDPVKGLISPLDGFRA